MYTVSKLFAGCLVGLSLLAGCSESFEREPVKEPVVQPKVAVKPADCNKAVFAYPTGDPKTSVALLEKCMPWEIVVGVPFDFTLTVINTSDTLCLDDVVVTDKMPSNMKLDSASPAATVQGDTAKWTLGRINPKETKTITCKGLVSSAGAVQQCAEMTCTPRACIQVSAVQPALKLVKSAPAEAMICDEIPMTLVVTNTGSGVARDVVVNDTLPAGLTTTDGKSSISVPIGALNPNQSKEIRILTKASKTGSFANSGTASAAGGLKTDSNSTTTVVKQPVLTITKKALQEKVLIAKGAGSFTHEITVKNTGDGVAAGTIVTDTPPAGVTVVKADGGTVSAGKIQFSAGDLKPGDSKTFSITFSTAAAGTYTDTATAAAKCASPVTAEAKTVVSGIPAVLLEMADDPDPVKIGDIVTYTIVVTNQGSADDTNIIVSADLTDEMTFVSCGPKNLPNNQPPGTTEKFTQIQSSNGKLDGKTVKFDAIPKLGAKQYVAWEIKVKANKAKDVRFWTTLTTDQTKAGGEIKKNESTNFYE